MSKREIVLDEPVMDEQSVALQQAVERAERAEAELEKIKRAGAHKPAPHAVSSAKAAPKQAAKADPAPSVAAGKESHPEADHGHALHHPELTGIDALREDAMMCHLLDSLEEGKDIGHYGRLTFTMIARHFLPDEDVIAELTRDQDFSEEQARLMVHQVEGRDYSPPRRERIAEWHAQQDYPIIPSPEDPDCGNVYRSLKFPTKTYSHIEHYQEEKLDSGK